MSKIWKCKIDDQIFDDISPQQWFLYSYLISKDKKQEMDNQVAMTDYLASFWNAEAVRKVQETRNNKGIHAFKNDKEFEESMISRDYKNSPLLDAILKLRKQEDVQPKIENSRQPRTKLPTDLSTIHKTLNKFNK